MILHEASNAARYASTTATRRYISAMVDFGASPRLAFEIIPIVDHVVPLWKARELGILRGGPRGTPFAAPAMGPVILVADDGELSMTPAAESTHP